MSKSICLIPAKGCSTRLPRKNLLPLNGVPLVALAIEKARNSELFDIVCVSTEDDEIANVARGSGAEVPFVRPIHLSRDPSTLIDVMLHALDHYSDVGVNFDKICVILPTSPFVTIDDVTQANKIFDEIHCDALMSVCATEFPPYNAWQLDETCMLLPCFPDSPFKFTKATECPRTYRSNGAILIVNVAFLRKERTYRSNALQSYVMPIERSLDIDTSLDYEFAKFLANRHNQKKPNRGSV
jgi:CMP-N,N'-diacetyllegionaminic acid synthase